MKMYRNILFLALMLIFIVDTANGQGNGQGENFHQDMPCLSDIDREEIQKSIDANKNMLGFIPSDLRLINDMIFPIRLKENIPGYKYFHGISNYVDHDNTSGIVDYDCRNTSYNGHKGTDIYPFPFEWNLVNNDLIQAISASAGTIVLKQDGNPHNNCSPNGQWNAVYVMHDDGSVLWYGHLKSGSLTEKSVGESVEQGEYLGVIASSGYSTGPHVHLEYYDVNNQLLDPYEGTCNDANSESLWADQLPHKTPKVNAVLTHSEQPRLICGPTSEVSALENVFFPTERVFVGVYLTDYVQSTRATTTILRPDNSVFDTFESFNNSNSYSWFWNSRNFILTENDMPGTWTIECEYRGEVTAHQFEFITDATSTKDNNRLNYSIFPNPATDIIYITSANPVDYRMYDSSGRLVLSESTTRSIDISSLEAGFYILKAEEDGIVHSETVIVH